MEERRHAWKSVDLYDDRWEEGIGDFSLYTPVFSPSVMLVSFS